MPLIFYQRRCFPPWHGVGRWSADCSILSAEKSSALLCWLNVRDLRKDLAQLERPLETISFHARIHPSWQLAFYCGICSSRIRLWYKEGPALLQPTLQSHHGHAAATAALWDLRIALLHPTEKEIQQPPTKATRHFSCTASTMLYQRSPLFPAS